MILSFKLEKDDPNDTSKVIRLSKPGEWKYRKWVDWDDKESVALLQKWRSQTFGRILGQQRAVRESWVESERDVLLKVVQQHLLTCGVRWSRIDFEAVTTEYNRLVAGTVQKAGELGAERRYSVKLNSRKTNSGNTSATQTNISRSLPLTKYRKALTRSLVVFRSQLQQFTHPSAQQIVAQAREKDKEARKAGETVVDADEDEEGLYEAGDGDEETKEETEDEAEDPDAQNGDVKDKEEVANARSLRARVLSAQAADTEEARQLALLTNPRQIAKDRAGPNWLRGG